MDFNDAPEQRNFDPIPDGSFVKLMLQVKPGGMTLPGMDPVDAGLFTGSKNSDVVYLSCEYTVLQPAEHAHRKLMGQNLTVTGGSLDDKGQSKGFLMTKQRVRAMLESAQGVDPKDESDAAKAKRRIQGFKMLDNIPFYAKLGIEPGGPAPNGGNYPDKNTIDRIVVPGDPEYADLVAGRPVEPKPRGSAHAKGGGSAGQTPAWSASTPSATNKAPAWTQPQTNPDPGTEAASQSQQAAATQAAAPVTGPAWLRG